MSKNDLLALASILLLNFYNQHKHSKSGKKVGGSTIYGEIVDLLAPVGINAFGASVVVLFLNDIFKKNKKQKGGDAEAEPQMGGTYVANIAKLVAPLGANAFFSVAALTLLAQLFDRKSFGLKSGVTKSVSALRKDLSKTVKTLTMSKKKAVVLKKKKATATKKKKVVLKKKKGKK